MEKASREHVIGIPVSSRAFGIEEPEFTGDESTYFGAAKHSATARTSYKSGRTTGDKFARGIKEHGKSFITLIYLSFIRVHISFSCELDTEHIFLLW